MSPDLDQQGSNGIPGATNIAITTVAYTVKTQQVPLRLGFFTNSGETSDADSQNTGFQLAWALEAC